MLLVADRGGYQCGNLISTCNTVRPERFSATSPLPVQSYFTPSGKEEEHQCNRLLLGNNGGAEYFNKTTRRAEQEEVADG